MRLWRRGPDGQGGLERCPPAPPSSRGSTTAGSSPCRTNGSRPMLETLIELFDPRRCPRTEARRLVEPGAGSGRARGGPAAALARRRAAGCAWRSACAGLARSARPSRRPGCGRPCARYQRHGLAWLQFLAGLRAGRHPRRRHGPRQDGADPGAHPGRERGRPAHRPLPGVCPTSLVANWRNEAGGSRRSCVVLILHGADRGQALRRRSPAPTWC